MLASQNAHAQSSAGLALRPYVAPAIPVAQSVPAPPLPAATPPEPQAPYLTQSRPYSIVAQSQIDAQQQEIKPPAAWNPASMNDVVAPPLVERGPEERVGRVAARGTPNLRGTAISRGRPTHRRALSRIFQDSGRALVYDLPEATADMLPWVDRGRKNEPFDVVLARVADDLGRASATDPQWAYGAHREIRALSKRLDRLPEPPPMPTQNGGVEPVSTPYGAPSLETRPFRPRPIWPGASGRPEAQVRPVTIITETGLQEGPRVTGVDSAYVPNPQEDGEVIPAPASSPRSRGTRARPRTK
jgi:hypothetical protein